MNKFYQFFSIILLIFITACSGQRSSNPDTTESNIQANSRSLSSLGFSSRIGSILEDSKGNFWFTAQNEGVCRFDGKQFTYFNEKQGLKQVRDIHEHTNGDIWFGIKDAVVIFDGQDFTTVYPEPKSKLITKSFGFTDNNYTEKWDKERNHFSFSAFSKNGIYKYDGKQLIHLTLPVHKGYPDYSNTEGYLPNHGWDIYAVYGIYEDNNGIMWFGTPGAGLFRYDGKSISCINQNIEKGVVRAIHQDSSGKIWFGNNAKAIYHYDGDTLINFSKQKQQDENGLNGALAIEIDKEENIWFGTFDAGLWRYAPSSDNNEQPLLIQGDALSNYSAESGLDANYISTLYLDKKGKLWVGTGKGRVFTFNGKTFDEFIGKK